MIAALAYLRITQGYRWIRETYNDDGSPANSYTPPLTTTEARDLHCAVHKNDPPPADYPFAIK